MSKVSDLIEENRGKKSFISFEYFPPRSEEAVERLYKRIDRMAKYNPLFIDCTWGAGGSTSTLTFEICDKTQKMHNISTNMHITCTNVQKQILDDSLEKAKAAGIRNIFALRGDPPRGEDVWKSSDETLSCAAHLVTYIKSKYGDYFSIGVAGYAEGHPTSMIKIENTIDLSESELLRLVNLNGEYYVCTDESFKKELEYLKHKVDCGADYIITQMILDVKTYILFEKECRAIGITCPIIPGILCIPNYGSFDRTCNLSKSHIPTAIIDSLRSLKDDEEQFKSKCVDITTNICQELINYGVVGLHFFSLNVDKSCLQIVSNLGYTRAIDGK